MSRRVPEEFGIRRKRFSISHFMPIALVVVLLFYVLTKPSVIVEENVTINGLIYMKSKESYTLFNELHNVKASATSLIPLRKVCYKVGNASVALSGSLKNRGEFVCWSQKQGEVTFSYRRRLEDSFTRIEFNDSYVEVRVTNPTDYKMELRIVVRDFEREKSGVSVNGKKVDEFIKDYYYSTSLLPGEDVVIRMGKKV